MFTLKTSRAIFQKYMFLPEKYSEQRNPRDAGCYRGAAFFNMTVATLCMMALIACGFWCICASYQLRNEDSVYHNENEFEKDEELAKKSSNGGNEVKLSA
uniref:Uncharacterized protein n=1 Tax=Caenorhabditis tropicalis TaxID=1561998 RepID=A0A1I7T337_9PELO